MRSLFFSRTTLIWLALMTATGVSWKMGHGMGFADPRHAGTAIILISVIKVRFVILEFMEIRHAPLFMRLIAELWTVVIGVAMIRLFLMA